MKNDSMMNGYLCRITNTQKKKSNKTRHQECLLQINMDEALDDPLTIQSLVVDFAEPLYVKAETGKTSATYSDNSREREKKLTSFRRSSPLTSSVSSSSTSPAPNAVPFLNTSPSSNVKNLLFFSAGDLGDSASSARNGGIAISGREGRSTKPVAASPLTLEEDGPSKLMDTLSSSSESSMLNELGVVVVGVEATGAIGDDGRLSYNRLARSRIPASCSPTTIARSV